jgi:hypothetical protein
VSLKIAMPDRRTKREPPAMAEASSNGSSRGKQTDFEFVSVVPTKDGRAKPKRQAVVRQNAAKYQWRNSKAAKTSVRKSAAANASTKEEPGVKKQQDEKNVGAEKRVTRPGHGLDGPRPALHMDYLSFAHDDEVAKILTFSTYIRFPIGCGLSDRALQAAESYCLPYCPAAGQMSTTPGTRPFYK